MVAVADGAPALLLLTTVDQVPPPPPPSPPPALPPLSPARALCPTPILPLSSVHAQPDTRVPPISGQPTGSAPSQVSTTAVGQTAVGQAPERGPGDRARVGQMFERGRDVRARASRTSEGQANEGRPRSSIHGAVCLTSEGPSRPWMGLPAEGRPIVAIESRPIEGRPLRVHVVPVPGFSGPPSVGLPRLPGGLLAWVWPQWVWLMWVSHPWAGRLQGLRFGAGV